MWEFAPGISHFLCSVKKRAMLAFLDTLIQCRAGRGLVPDGAAGSPYIVGWNRGIMLDYAKFPRDTKSK
jgi:hypothetical protein